MLSISAFFLPFAFIQTFSTSFHFFLAASPTVFGLSPRWNLPISSLSSPFLHSRFLHSLILHSLIHFFPSSFHQVRAILWLENYLQSWKSTVLVVSHDREFLNSIATDTIHLHSKRLDAYKGNYENFLKTRTERLKCQQKEYEAQKEYRDHIQVYNGFLLPNHRFPISAPTF